MIPSPANVGEEEYNSKSRGLAASEAMERTSSPRKRVLTSDVTQIDFSYNYNIFKQAEELFREGRHRLRKGTKSYGWFGWTAVFLPCLHWLRRYRVREWLLPDILAGLSVGAMVIPQGMSYANLAGVPNVYGLYGAFVPTLVYALLGSSRQLAVGPVAVTSILLGNSIPGIMSELGLPVNANPNSPDDPEAQAVYDRVVIQVAFLAGCIYTLVGLLRLGWITSFLSHAVVSGFMTGASVQIALSQVKYICGVSMSRQNPVQDQLRSLVGALGGFSWREFAMGMAFMALLLAFKAAAQRFPRLVLLRALGPLCVCALSIAVMNIFGLWDSPSAAQPYIKPIGAVPKGLPQVTVGWWFPLYLPGRQVVLAVLVALIDLCESISIAKALAQRNGYVLNSTQELRGLGIANLAGAAFNCYTTTGSFSRSAVNNAVGARTPLASAVTGVVVCFVLLFLTPVFAHMSQNAMGAIVIVGVLQLFDIQEAVFLFRVNFFDFLVWLVACAVVLFVGVEWGIAASVALSLLIFIFRSAFPAVQRLSPIPGTPFF
ncbi:sulfate transporter, partial [Helicosporidium sp. ATCC 50920]